MRLLRISDSIGTPLALFYVALTSCTMISKLYSAQQFLRNGGMRRCIIDVGSETVEVFFFLENPNQKS